MQELPERRERMTFNRKYKILLLSSSTKLNTSLLSLLSDSSLGPVKALETAEAARHCLNTESFDIVIINTPLPDESGLHLAAEVCADGSRGVLVFVKAAHYTEVSTKLSPYGILTLAKPLSKDMILQSLQLLRATLERLNRAEDEKAELSAKIEELRIISRAKGVLIDQLRMTEAEAHRYIEKQAMDRCISRRAVAEKILSAYR